MTGKFIFDFEGLSLITIKNQHLVVIQKESDMQNKTIYLYKKRISTTLPFKIVLFRNCSLCLCRLWIFE